MDNCCGMVPAHHTTQINGTQHNYSRGYTSLLYPLITGCIVQSAHSFQFYPIFDRHLQKRQIPGLRKHYAFAAVGYVCVCVAAQIGACAWYHR